MPSHDSGSVPSCSPAAPSLSSHHFSPLSSLPCGARHPIGALDRRTRALMGVIGLGLLALLITASRLAPSAQGHGTHQQLGLPPCTFLSLFGHRCPACGMTTAWAHVVRGELRAALVANVGGALLAIAAGCAVPWLLLAAIGGRWWPIAPREGPLAWAAGGFVALTLLDWLTRGGLF